MTIISEADSRAMVRLLGETAAHQGSHAEMKRHLMAGLCDLIAADAWVWTLGRVITPGAPQAYAGFLHGGFDETRFANLLKAIEHPLMGEVAATFYEEVGKGIPTTMIRDEIDPKGLAHADGVRECWESADVGSLIMAGHPLDGKSLSGLGIYRKFSDPPFTEREKQIAHIILTEVPWLHATGWPEDRGAKVPELSPKQRIVLNLLLDGLDRKTIAVNLEITENTVAGYARELYRHFGVKSQPQLIRRFFKPEPVDES